MIKGQNISWSYNTKKKTPILKQVSFDLRKGRMTTFMGQSGAGKTTLLRCIANLVNQYEGTITHQGEDLKNLNKLQRASTIGFVFQQFHLFPHLSVLKNCTYALTESFGFQAKEADERAIEILASLKMEQFMEAFPSQLSGGQQQRAAIARALVLRPQVLLLDEPTSALDPHSKNDLEAILLTLKEKGITIALSSHDMPFIRKMIDYVYFIHQGEIVEEWDQKEEFLASNEKIKQFLTHE